MQDVVGPVCETGDYLALNRKLPPFAAGDLMAFMTAGAYGAAMSSTYNTRLLVPEVLVKGGDYAVVRPRPSYDDLIGSTACRSGWRRMSCRTVRHPGACRRDPGQHAPADLMAWIPGTCAREMPG